MPLKLSAMARRAVGSFVDSCLQSAGDRLSEAVADAVGGAADLAADWRSLTNDLSEAAGTALDRAMRYIDTQPFQEQRSRHFFGYRRFDR